MALNIYEYLWIDNEKSQYVLKVDLHWLKFKFHKNAYVLKAFYHRISIRNDRRV
jgi:hypothetical protein